MKKTLLYIIIGIAGLLVAACKPSAELPSNFEQLETTADIYPDYTDIIIPCNIAPLNFIVRDSMATAYVAQLQGGGQQVLAGAGEDGIIQMDTTQWRSLLDASKGGDIKVSIYAQRPNGWVCFKSHTLSVAEEPIDSYLSYRLIEPGYELYRQLGLYQRNLTNWDQHVIYENNREYDDANNHCINCHNYRGGDASDMLFHVRANHGGTIIVKDGKAEKVQIKDSTIITAGVYPSWHPSGDLIAFSTNKTGQTFHVFHSEKIEVMDDASDLLLYDVKTHEVSHILRTRNYLETFPCWSPDGKMLYYCSARRDHLLDPSLPDSTITQQLVLNYDKILYNLMAIPFDAKTRQWGEPQVVVNASEQGRSVSVPRVSPDGRYLLYTQGRYGQFHIWHKSADLWVKDLQTDSCYALTEANSPDVDSFHSWSTNGRWIAFSTRRMDQNYTRIFLAYFDKNGQAHKAFAIPQEDPEMNILLLKSYNVPELSRNAVQISASDLHKCIYETEGTPAVYKRTERSTMKDAKVDAETGASPRRMNNQ